MGKLCNFAGTMLVILVILISAPFFIPALFGIQSFSVLTGSMEPMYPKNSVVYVKTTDPGDIGIGDIITFYKNADSNEVITHRVVRVDREKQAFHTKGDANKSEDVEEVSYSRVVGRVVYTVPHIGFIAMFVQTTAGKVCEVVVLIAGAMLWYISALLKKDKKAEKN